MFVKEEGDRFDFGKSIKNFVWHYNEANQRAVQNLVQKLDISEILATILVNRDIFNIEDAENYLQPKIKNCLLDPFDLKDMDKAAARIALAIKNKEKITIFGDYDVDGATSSALLKRFFRDVGLDADIYIPNRINEGYGPNINALKKIKDKGSDLVICVDCGTVSFEPLKEAKDYGLEVIVLDHHLSLETIPEAVAVVNPNRFDDDFPFKSLAAVGVAFLSIIAVRKTLRDLDYFSHKKEPDLLKYLDLVALGTVCDVMNLQGINRAFVAQGLKLIAKGNNLGIKALAKVAKMDGEPHSYHLGFILGPRINAGGRIGEGMLGAELLSTDDPIKAIENANYLEQLNAERRAIEANILDETIEQIIENNLHKQALILVSGNDWHQGVLGILASRIKEKFNRPSAVISVVDGIGKGSARSIPGVDLGSLLANAKEENILIEGGGHAMAGGFSIAQDKIEMFKQYAEDKLSSKLALYSKAREINVDAIISATAINAKLVKTIQQASPFGNGNPQPKIVVMGVTITKIKIVGKGHIMIIVLDKNTDPDMQTFLKCMLFKGNDSSIGKMTRDLLGKEVNLLGSPQINRNNPSKADFIIDDLAIVS